MLNKIFGGKFPGKNSILINGHQIATRNSYSHITIPVLVPEIGEVPFNFLITDASWKWICEYKEPEVINKLDQICFSSDHEERKWIMHMYYYLKYLHKDFIQLAQIFHKFKNYERVKIFEFGSGFGATLIFLRLLCDIYNISSCDIFGTEIFLLDSRQNKSELKKSINIFSILKAHVNQHNLSGINLIPYHQNKKNKVELPSDLNPDLVFSLRSFNYLYTNQDYEGFLKNIQNQECLLMFDFCDTLQHTAAPKIHLFTDLKKVSHLKKSSPSNAIRLLLPVEAYMEYEGIVESNGRKGIFKKLNNDS